MYNDFINGDANLKSRYIGRAVGEIGLTIAGTKGVDEVVKGIRVADKVGEVANVINKADNVIEGTSSTIPKVASKPFMERNWLQSFGSEGAGEVKNTVTKFSDPYSGVKQASEYLKSQGLPRELRKDILESFDTRTITMDMAGENTYGIRFFGKPPKPYTGSGAKANGPFLFETFTPQINRSNLALPPNWNGMTGLQQWQIKQGIPIIKGTIAPQFNFGTQYIGGAKQMWVPNPWENLIKP